MTQKKEPSQRQLRVAEEIQHVLGRMLIEDNLFPTLVPTTPRGEEDEFFVCS